MAFTNEAGDGSSWETTVEMAENGDGTSSFWTNFARKILNRTAYLYAQLTLGPTLAAGEHYGLSSRSVTRSALPVFELFSAHTVSVGGTVVPADDSAKQALDLPHGATLTSVKFAVNPANATPPAGTKIKMSITKNTVDGNNATADILLFYTDPATSTAYGDPHVFASSTLAEVIDRETYTYWVSLKGETGSGAGACEWSNTTWTATVTAIDDGAA